MLSMIAFGVLALIILTAAIKCVSSRNVIHGAYWLLLCAVGTAGMTWFLGAEYLAIAQLLIYAGAVGILTIFTVMVTHRSLAQASREVKLSWSVLVLALGFFGLIAYGVIATPQLAQFTTAAEPIPFAEFGMTLFNLDGYTFALEAAALVLLVAIIAAVWWTKSDKAIKDVERSTSIGDAGDSPQAKQNETEASADEKDEDDAEEGDHAS
ncbi:MAG: NADH-quinone oxidoreductase subunit J [Coriobacteriia bacterium]|nr:NADH-quinone oxidoreductase subunit J [Coriobacteriia bacterium]